MDQSNVAWMAKHVRIYKGNGGDDVGEVQGKG